MIPLAEVASIDQVSLASHAVRTPPVPSIASIPPIHCCAARAVPSGVTHFIMSAPSMP